MNDSISRQDAINIVNFECGEWTGLAKTIANELEKLPSTEPIIRCKNCKYSVDEYEDGDCYCKRPSHELVWIGENWDFFCADARKKGGA